MLSNNNKINPFNISEATTHMCERHTVKTEFRKAEAVLELRK